jgi:molybdenum cofactor biosynthesis enzyme
VSLTHFDEAGRAAMVDVAGKAETSASPSRVAAW